jgi:hypothetical protein
MTKDEQEALSRLYSDDIIRLLPLKSGAVAVFNNARDLCGIIERTSEITNEGEATVWEQVIEVWYPPKKPPAVDLEELGLV